jgi:hypothetical protein
MRLYLPFCLVALLVLVVFHLVRATLDDTIRRLSRHWLPFLAFFFLCVTAAGYALNGFGVPSLFRDDPQLYTLHGWLAIRNSAVVWSSCFVTLFLFAAWGFVYHVEALDPPYGALSSRSRATARRYILVNGLPMSLFLLGAVALPRGEKVAGADLARGVLGVAIAVLVLWIVTAAVVWLRSVARLRRVTAHPALARLLDWVSRVVIGPAATVGAGDGEAAAGFTARLREAPKALVSPPVRDDRRRSAVGAATVFVLMLLAFLTFVTVYPVLQASVSIVLLLAWVLMLYSIVTLFRPWLRLWIVGALVAYVLWVNAGPFQHVFPELERYYREQEMARLAPGDPEHVVLSPEGLIPPIKSLTTWRAGPGAHCSNLVIFATSGGAYRSAYWTAAVLDEVERLSGEPNEFADLAGCIRIITGASGGMVGASYYAAMKNEALPDGRIGSVIERLDKDTMESRRRKEGAHFPTRFPYSRDSLTPVAQQLAQRDVFHVLWPGRMAIDRGVVLEEQWSTLDSPFADLRTAEAEGRIPSLLVSPTVFSTTGKSFAQPLLISNLKVDSLTGPYWRHAVPFFALFPEVRDSFRLRTAIRMNATFPYVSPAAYLPTDPPARVVDAGYYENYGLATAASWLFSASDLRGGETAIEWLGREGLGVILIQARAFPFNSASPTRKSACHDPATKDDARRSGHGFSFLTTPIEAVAAVRESGMNIRNEQQYDLLEALQREGRLQSVSLENTSDVGMSWYLTPAEVECLRKEVHSEYNKGQWARLGEMLRNEAIRSWPAKGNSEGSENAQ